MRGDTIRLRNALLAGLGIRELLSFWTGHPFDFEIWVRLGYYVSRGLDPYVSTSPVQGLSMPGTGALPSIGYPPVWAIIQAWIYGVYSAIGLDSRFVYYFLIKQEMIIPDALAALLIYRVLRKWGEERGAERAFSFWMTCPFVIIISSVWGMFDQLVLFFVLLAVIAVDGTLRSSVMEGFGIVLKVIPIIFLPGLAWAQSTTGKRFAYLVAAVGFSVSLAVFPYLLYGGWDIGNLFRTEFSTVSKVSNSVNYWVVPYVLYSLSLLPLWTFSTLSLLGYAWIPALLFAYWWTLRGMAREQFTMRFVVLLLQFATVVFLLTRSSVNEQYVIYFIGLGLLDRHLGGEGRSRTFAGVWVSATAFLLANNTYLVRFLAPVSSVFILLDTVLSTGWLGGIRFGIMIAAGLAFTVFCASYLKSLYSDIRRLKTAIPIS